MGERFGISILHFAARFLLMGLLATGSAVAHAAEKPTLVDLELVLAVDVSASVDPVEARLQRKGYVDALLDPGVIAAIQGGTHRKIAVTYVEWAGAQNTRMVVPWAVIEDRASAFAFSTFVEAAPVGFGHWTSISGAIRYSVPLFENNGYQGPRRAIDVSADGPNNDGQSPDKARDMAIALGITVNGLPIVNKRPQASGEPQIPDYDVYFRDCVIGGPGAFLVVAKDYNSFSKAIRRKLLFEIAGRLPAGDDIRYAAGSRRRSFIHTVSDHQQFDCDIGKTLKQRDKDNGRTY